MSKKPLFCDDCGTRNTPDSKYCKECGSQIHAAYQTLALSAFDHMDDAAQQERLTQFLDMAFWHTEAGNTDAALRACGAALALNPNSTTAHSLLGSLYEKKGEDALAVKHFERVLALNPDSEADRVKLAQVREGVHAQPIRPSSVYRWLPPVFATARFSGLAQGAREKWAALRRPEMTLLPARPTPALAAGALAVLLLAGCLFLIRPGPQAQATVTPARPTVAQSAYGGAAPGRTASAAAAPLPAPVVLRATPGTPLASPSPAAPAIAALPRTDPFAATSSLRPFVASAVPPAPPLPVRSHVRAAGRGGLHPLPALSLVAVPPANEGPLPPAPVQVPSSMMASAPASAGDGIARHTVVVQHLDGPRPAWAGAPSANDGSAAAPASHIEITIDRSPASGRTTAALGASSGGGADGGEGYQQTAFALQQQGNYSQAQAAYQKAVRAYQAQIASGRDLDAAKRGLDACKTGLQICQQSQ